MNKQKQDEIITAISIESGIDPATVRTVFVGMVRYILKTLRYKGICPLPDFGIFRITEYKRRRAQNVNTGVVEMMGERKVIKFEPDYKLKHYIKEKA